MLAGPEARERWVGSEWTGSSWDRDGRDKPAVRMLGGRSSWRPKHSCILPLADPLLCPQFPHQHLSEAARTLSASTQDLGPR